MGINFSRIFDFRKGYGYYGIEDSFKQEKHPKDDGIFLIDFFSGKSKLIISYDTIYHCILNETIMDEKLLVNHITFNEDGSRFLFLLRNFPNETSQSWGTTLITSDLDGNMNLLLENKFVSHYFWKNDKQILSFCAPKDKKGLFLIDDKTAVTTQLRSPYPRGPFGGYIHCSFSPDKRFILGDGYADVDGYRPLFLYDTETEITTQLLKSKSVMDASWDIRCDLHARFNKTGDKISFDSVHDGKRKICLIDLYK